MDTEIIKYIDMNLIEKNKLLLAQARTYLELARLSKINNSLESYTNYVLKAKNSINKVRRL